MNTQYKETPVGKIPENWKVERLGNEDIALLIMGQSPPSITYNRNKEGLPFFQGKAEFGFIYPEPIVYCKKPIKIAEANDILLSVRAPVGDVNIAPSKSCIGRGIAAIRTKKEKLHYLYLFYYLSFDKKRFETLSMGSTFKAIRKEEIENYLLPLPPVYEQKTISSILSTVDNAIQKADESIAKTEFLKKALAQELLTKGIGHKEFKDTEIGKIPKQWKIERLGDNSELIVPMRDKPKKFDGHIPWIRIEDFDGKYISISKSNRKVSEETIKKMNLKPYPVGTVLCSCSGEMGICSIVKSTLVSNQTFIGIVPNEKLISEYLYYLLTNLKTKLQILGTGTTIPYISRKKFEKYKIPIPLISEQQKIVEILSTVDKKLELQRHRKAKLERIKKCLMNDLLTGKKRVKIGRMET